MSDKEAMILKEQAYANHGKASQNVRHTQSDQEEYNVVIHPATNGGYVAVKTVHGWKDGHHFHRTEYYQAGTSAYNLSDMMSKIFGEKL